MADIDDVIATAQDARQAAYAPHSGFRMGSAVETTDGRIVAGSLVENVSLGLAMCSERVALFSCVSLRATPKRLVLVSPRTSGSITRPCGACLQVGLELGGPDLEVVAVAADDGERVTHRLGDLLPEGPYKQ